MTLLVGVEAEVRQTVEERIERHSCLEQGQVRTGTEVSAEAEGEMRLRLAPDIEKVGPVVTFGIAAGRPQQQDHFGAGELFFRFAEDGQAVDFVHPQIGDDDVERLALDECGAALAGGGDGAIVAGLLEAVGDGLGVGLVVVD